MSDKKQYIIKSDNKIKTHDNGFKKDNPDNKVEFSLIPFTQLEKLGAHFTNGARKYGKYNWQKANTAEQINGFKEAAIRHALKWAAGVDDGEDHGSAAITNIMMHEELKIIWKIQNLK